MKNFSFEHDGKTLWYSRSIAVSVFVYCKDNEGNWCALINKRGKGCPTKNGYWCVPAGYLDFHEDLCQCGMRETFEETGISIPRVLMNYYAINSIPNISDNENVVVLYYAVLPGITDDYELTSKNSEKDEVDDIMWIPLSMIMTTDIPIAFNNDNILLDIYNKKIINMK